MPMTTVRPQACGRLTASPGTPAPKAVRPAPTAPPNSPRQDPSNRLPTCLGALHRAEQLGPDHGLHHVVRRVDRREPAHQRQRHGEEAFAGIALGPQPEHDRHSGPKSDTRVERNSLGVDQYVGVFQSEIGQWRRQARDQPGHDANPRSDRDGARPWRRPRQNIHSEGRPTSWPIAGKSERASAPRRAADGCRQLLATIARPTRPDQCADVRREPSA